LAMWRETGLRTVQNVELLNSTIVFISQRLQRSHWLRNHWPWSGSGPRRGVTWQRKKLHGSLQCRNV